jgi:hypothetical protein
MGLGVSSWASLRTGGGARHGCDARSGGGERGIFDGEMREEILFFVYGGLREVWMNCAPKENGAVYEGR